MNIETPFVIFDVCTRVLERHDGLCYNISVILTQQGTNKCPCLNQRSSMKEYELTVLIHPDLEMNLELATDKVKSLLEKSGGKILKEESEGKKRLAYRIKKQDFAVYYYYEVELPAEAPAKVSSALNITDEVLRYLLVIKDERRTSKSDKDKVEKNEEVDDSEEQELEDNK